MDKLFYEPLRILSDPRKWCWGSKLQYGEPFETYPLMYTITGFPTIFVGVGVLQLVTACLYETAVSSCSRKSFIGTLGHSRRKSIPGSRALRRHRQPTASYPLPSPPRAPRHAITATVEETSAPPTAQCTETAREAPPPLRTCQGTRRHS